MSTTATNFGITDAGEFIESCHRCEQSNSLYGKLIGRRKVVVPSQKLFTTADIAIEGYLKKEGSWRKSWKTRYFILRKDIRTLCVFTSKDEYALIGAIPLDRDSVVYSDVRSADDVNHIFGVKRLGQDKPEILLSAPDEATKRLWLDALILESQRTDEVVAADWWADLFGDVPTMDTKTISEVVSRRRAAEQASGQRTSSRDVFSEQEESELADSMETVRLAMPDQDSDDEVEEGLPPPAPCLRTEHSVQGSTLFLEGRDESDVPPVGPSPLAKDSSQSSAQSQTTREASSSSNVGSDERINSSASGVLAPRGTPVKKERRKDKDHMKKALDSVKSSDKKQKPVSAAPLQYPSAERHETSHGFAGLKLSLRIEHMCQHMDRFFLVIFSGHSAGGEGGGITWKPLSRTEEVCVEEKPEYGETTVGVTNKQFSLLQGPTENESASHLMFILFRNEHQKANGATGYNFSNHSLVSKTTLKRDVLNTPCGLFRYDMTVLMERFIDLSSSPWMAQKSRITLGIAVVSSPKVTMGRKLLQKRMGVCPYAETAYGLRSAHGQVLALEELFISKFSIAVPQSFLSMVFVERMQQMSDISMTARDDTAEHVRNLNELNTEILKDYFADTTGPVPRIPPRLFVQPGCFNNFTPVPTGGLGMSELNTRVAALKKLCSVLERMKQVVFEYYENSYRHYLRISAGGALKNAVISNEFSGSHLRRSVWKKTPTWQFAPVNLNVQVLMSQVMPVSYLKANSETIQVNANTSSLADSSALDAEMAYQTVNENDVQYFPSMTHGAFAAHSLGFAEGGLRRLFSKISPDDVKLEWLQTLQASGGLRYVALEPLIKEYPDHAEALFSLSSHPDDPANFYSRAFNLALRIDICLSQAMAHAVTSLRVLLSMATLGLPEYVERLKCALIAGFLIPIESLLSSQGHEMGMIEDLDGILTLLNSIFFRFVRPAQSTAAGSERSGSDSPIGTPRGSSASSDAGLQDSTAVNILRDVRGCLVVDVSVTAEEEVVLRSCASAAAAYEEWASSSAYRLDRGCPAREPPRCNYKIGHAIPDVVAIINVCAVVFTQGVNEMQTLANMSGDAYKQSLINEDSMLKLKKYTSGYIDVLQFFHSAEWERRKSEQRSSATVGSAPVASDFDEFISEPSEKIAEIKRLQSELDSTVQLTVSNPNEKNVNVLLNASRIGRYISGYMSILCKSGKDRTSMSVTLEQTRYLAESLEVQGGVDLCRVMRRHGVRRMNVWGNTGQSLYAFNSIQRQILPTCYAPPEGTFSGSVMS